MTMLIAGGIVLLLIVVFACTRRPVLADADTDAWYEDDKEEEESQPVQVKGAFRFDYYYRWDALAPFLWALGFSRAESEAMYTRGFVEVWRNGFHAEFDATLGQYDADGEPLFACHVFDSHADTEATDRWRRVPDAQAMEAYRSA